MFPRRPPEQETPRYIPLMVSLYFVLLAFFILLTAFSNFDPPKQQSIMASVKGSFANNGRGAAQEANTESGASVPHATRLQQFQNLFPEVSPRTLPAHSAYPLRVEVDLAAERLMPYPEGLTDAQKETLHGIADLWSGAQPPEHLSIGLPWRRDAAANRSAIQGLGLLARELEGYGVPASDLHLGLQEDIPDRGIRLQLTLPGEVP